MPGWTSSNVTQEDNRYQVLTQEWFIAFGGMSEADCQEYFDKKLKGRIKDEDWRIRPFTLSSKAFKLQTRVWSTRAEFESEEQCANWVKDNLLTRDPDDIPAHAIVMRNSPEAAKYLEYGTKKLARMEKIRGLKDAPNPETSN